MDGTRAGSCGLVHASWLQCHAHVLADPGERACTATCGAVSAGSPHVSCSRGRVGLCTCIVGEARGVAHGGHPWALGHVGLCTRGARCMLVGAHGLALVGEAQAGEAHGSLCVPRLWLIVSFVLQRRGGGK